MSRHFGQWDAEPEGSDDDLEESQRDGYAEMQAELAEIAADWQKDNEADLFWQESNTNKERIEDFRNEY